MHFMFSCKSSGPEQYPHNEVLGAGALTREIQPRVFQQVRLTGDRKDMRHSCLAGLVHVTGEGKHLTTVRGSKDHIGRRKH